jgi:hypothetical protein
MALPHHHEHIREMALVIARVFLHNLCTRVEEWGLSRAKSTNASRGRKMRGYAKFSKCYLCIPAIEIPVLSENISLTQ